MRGYNVYNSVITQCPKNQQINATKIIVNLKKGCTRSSKKSTFLENCNFTLQIIQIQNSLHSFQKGLISQCFSQGLSNENEIVPIFLYHRIYDLYTQVNENPNLQPNGPSHFGQQSLPRLPYLVFQVGQAGQRLLAKLDWSIWLQICIFIQWGIEIIYPVIQKIGAGLTGPIRSSFSAMYCTETLLFCF